MVGEAKKDRLVLVVYPFQGHINPVLQLATILHSRGFAITIVHPEYNSPDHSSHPEFTFLSIEDRLLHDNVPTSNFLATVRSLNEHCQEPFRLCLERILEEEQPRGRITAVFFDMLMYFVQSVVDLFNLPAIAIRTNAAAALVAMSLLPCSDQELGYVYLKDVVDLGPELQPLTLKSPSSGSRYSEEELLEFRVNVTRTWPKCSAIIVNTMNFLEQESLTVLQKYYPALVLAIGPFHKLAPGVSYSLLVEDRSCSPWLDKQSPKSVIYISFGSMAKMGEQELLEVAWGLADSEQPFLWVIRPDMASDLNKLLPRNFHERVGGRGCIVQWAPQVEVLQHTSVGGFWTHCGWNSTLESVGEGVPMLCRPFFADQPLDMSYICDVWKTGIALDGEFERGRIAEAVRKLMVGKEGEEARRRAAELKQKAELCLKEGGSSIESLNALVNLLLKLG